MQDRIMPNRAKDVHSAEIYSSMLLGAGACGRTTLFITPIGQAIPRSGRVSSSLFPSNTPLTTNLMQAGQLGCAIGDFSVKSLRLDFIGAMIEDIQSFLEIAHYRLIVAGKMQSEGGARDLPKLFNPQIPISRVDTLVLDIDFEDKILRPLERPFLLRAVLSGLAISDIR